MGATQLTTRQIGSVQKNDFDVITAGQAVITKIITGTNISFSSTGVDAGTGDVTINAIGDMILGAVQNVTGAKTFGGIGAVDKFILAGNTSGVTILNAAAIAGAGTITLPTGTDTLAGLATVQTFSSLNTFKGTATSDGVTFGVEQANVTATATNWTLAGTNLNVGGYTHVTTSTVPLVTALAAASGTYYQITWTISAITAGTVDISFGGVNNLMTGISSSGATGILSTSTAFLTLTPTTNFDGTVVLSIKVIGTSTPLITFNSSDNTTSKIELRGIGTSSIGIGNLSLRRLTTGTNNIGVGSQALLNNTSGGNNTAFGNTALGNNNQGNSNNAQGSGALGSNTTGSSNNAVGTTSLSANTTGSSNTGVGNTVLLNNTTGSNNAAIGALAGRYITDGTTAATIVNNSILIGANTKVSADNQTNQIVIGYNAIGDGSNTTVIGNSSIISSKLQGQLLLPGYGTGTKTGTPTFNLQVTSTGQVIEGTLSGGSGITRSINNISTTTTGSAAASIDYVYLMTSTFTYTQPTAVSNTNRYTLKNAGVGIITINFTSGQTADGSTSITLRANNSIDLISNATNWFVV